MRTLLDGRRNSLYLSTKSTSASVKQWQQEFSDSLEGIDGIGRVNYRHDYLEDSDKKRGDGEILRIIPATGTDISTLQLDTQSQLVIMPIVKAKRLFTKPANSPALSYSQVEWFAKLPSRMGLWLWGCIPIIARQVKRLFDTLAALMRQTPWVLVLLELNNGSPQFKPVFALGD